MTLLCTSLHVHPVSALLTHWGGLCQGQQGRTCTLTTPLHESDRKVTCTLTNQKVPGKQATVTWIQKLESEWNSSLLSYSLVTAAFSIRSPQVFCSTRLLLSSDITLEQSTLLSPILFLYSIICICLQNQSFLLKTLNALPVCVQLCDIGW